MFKDLKLSKGLLTSRFPRILVRAFSPCSRIHAAGITPGRAGCARRPDAHAAPQRRRLLRAQRCAGPARAARDRRPPAERVLRRAGCEAPRRPVLRTPATRDCWITVWIQLPFTLEVRSAEECLNILYESLMSKHFLDTRYTNCKKKCINSL